MDKIVNELKNTRSADLLGILVSFLIIVFSIFGTQIDTMIPFLFGAGLLCTSISAYYGKVVQENSTIRELDENKKEKTTKTKKWFDPELYKIRRISLNVLSAICFILFLIYIIQNFFNFII